MTGPRRVRGRLGDDRRGRIEGPAHEPVRAHSELEELSVGRVTSRGRPRPGLQATVLAGALILLLAVGFGAFGGRGERNGKAASTGSPAVATHLGAAAETPVVTPVVTPAVTPYAPCAAAPPSPPDVRLTFNGQAIPAAVELLEQPRGVPVSSAPARGPAGGPRTRVPAEAVASIWTGAACANAWTIKVGGAVVDALGNDGLQPAYASQNRFDVFLAPYGGAAADLAAELAFQTMVIRATWPLIIEPYPLPPASFANDGNERWKATAGCDITLQLRNALVGLGNGCAGIVSEQPRVAASNPAGGRLAFEINGWQFGSAYTSCGHVVGLDYEADPASGCPEGEFASEASGSGNRVEFTGPTSDGTWTVAVTLCASPTDGPDGGSICGTWYGDVVVGGSAAAT